MWCTKRREEKQLAKLGVIKLRMINCESSEDKQTQERIALRQVETRKISEQPSERQGARMRIS